MFNETICQIANGMICSSVEELIDSLKDSIGFAEQNN
jgi:hypothetical protein